MPNKKKWPYQNIPVKPDVYMKVAMIADANGIGMGEQLKNWAERELPECDHEKVSVLIEPFNTGGSLPVIQRFAWYCATCKRVYVRVSDDDAEPIITRAKVSHV